MASIQKVMGGLIHAAPHIISEQTEQETSMALAWGWAVETPKVYVNPRTNRKRFKFLLLYKKDCYIIVHAADKGAKNFGAIHSMQHIQRGDELFIAGWFSEKPIINRNGIESKVFFLNPYIIFNMTRLNKLESLMEIADDPSVVAAISQAVKQLPNDNFFESATDIDDLPEYTGGRSEEDATTFEDDGLDYFK